MVRGKLGRLATPRTSRVALYALWEMDYIQGWILSSERVEDNFVGPIYAQRQGAEIQAVMSANGGGGEEGKLVAGINNTQEASQLNSDVAATTHSGSGNP